MASEILYAQTLIPDAFAGMLSVSDIGWQLDRLPANNDPMLARISRVRNQEYLFCDAIDEQYGDLACVSTYTVAASGTGALVGAI